MVQRGRGHVAELVYAYVSEAYVARLGSSSLPMPTRNLHEPLRQFRKGVAWGYMDMQPHLTPASLERYAFYWTEARLVVAAAALLLGGFPPVYMLLPIPALYGLLTVGLKLAWIVSGVASGYLVYRWYQNDQKVFCGTDTKDKVAFLFSVVTGINLGITGLLGVNIGMSITSSPVLYAIAGLAYLLVAGYLWKRWSASGHHIV